MKIIINSDQRYFFKENGFLVLEEMLSSSQLERIQKQLSFVLSNRFGELPESVWNRKEHELFQRGHRLILEKEELQKQLLAPFLSNLVAEMTGKRSLRFVYDQLICGADHPLQEELSLIQISSVQGVVGGVLICLRGPEEESESQLPQHPGDTLILLEETPIPFDQMEKGSRYMLLVYAEPNAVYIHNDSDYHVHFLKDKGYAFGDKLKEHDHPMVCRRH